MDEVIRWLCDELAGSLPFEISIQAHDPLCPVPDIRLVFLEPHKAGPVFLSGPNKETGCFIQSGSLFGSP